MIGGLTMAPRYWQSRAELHRNYEFLIEIQFFNQTHHLLPGFLHNGGIVSTSYISSSPGPNGECSGEEKTGTPEISLYDVTDVMSSLMGKLRDVITCGET